MVTGQRHMVQTTNSHINIPKVLSILVSLDGLSFCVLSLGKIVTVESVTFESQLNPAQVLDRLKLSLSNAKLLTTEFEKVHLTISNEMFTCVPDELFEDSQLTNYLKFSTKLLKTDFADFDHIDALNTNVVYIPFTNITNYIFDQFGDFTYKHSATVFTETLLNSNRHDCVALNVDDQYMELVVLKDSKLQLANRFRFATKEDFIYYILFTYEQLDLDRESFPLLLSGKINDTNKHFELAFKYIRNVSLLAYEGFAPAEDISIASHEHLLIRHGLL